MIVLDGKLVRDKILENIKSKISDKSLEIGLAIILIGNNEASKIYVENKIKMCKKVGMKPYLYELSEDVLESEVIELIKLLSEENKIHGIIVQSPTPMHIDFKKCVSFIDSYKDIDGLGMNNTYDNYLNNKCILPCTVKGILKLLEYYKIDVSGKDITILGKGLLVGKPLSIALMNLGATVTICSSKTSDLKNKCKHADIIVSATGIKNLVKEDFVKDNAVVIDVGITRDNDKIIGDVDYEAVKDKCSYITPVPGGVGPMTVAMVISNTYDAYERINNG